MKVEESNNENKISLMKEENKENIFLKIQN
jgi:hypothetical protein